MRHALPATDPSSAAGVVAELTPPASSGGLSEPEAADLARRVSRYADELVDVRRDLHAHPELSRAEVRTTRIVRERLERAGLEPRVLPGGTGLVCDVGQGERALALRADLDALPLADVKDVAYRSTVPGVCHACGHDIHTAVVLGAGLVLGDLAREGRLRRRVRLIFQHAEEAMPGGALDVITAGGLKGVEQALAVHCDPRTPLGTIGLRSGPITAASDKVGVRLTGRGGHTARPHMTGDLVYALGKVVTELPAALSRRVDPRAGLSLVWGHIAAGSTPNAIPAGGECAGTVRCLDVAAWQDARELVESLVHSVVAPYGVRADVDYVRGVPPVTNDSACVDLLAAAGRSAISAEAIVPTQQSLGGEDFAWYLDRVPGALARLGTTPEGVSEPGDLHQPTYDPDERAIGIGARLLAAAALLAPPGANTDERHG
jgi:amidohydrolase